jgi:hypothetical protein
LVAFFSFAYAPTATAVESVCKPDYIAPQIAAEVPDDSGLLLIGYEVETPDPPSVLLARYLPDSKETVFADKSGKYKSICFSRLDSTFTTTVDGTPYVYHWVRAKAGHYAIVSRTVSTGSDWLNICFADETIAFEVKPGRTNYVGRVIFREITRDAIRAARSAPGYLNVDHGKPWGIENVDQSTAPIATQLAEAKVGFPLEPTTNVTTTFVQDTNWLGTLLCYSRTEGP